MGEDDGTPVGVRLAGQVAARPALPRLSPHSDLPACPASSTQCGKQRHSHGRIRPQGTIPPARAPAGIPTQCLAIAGRRLWLSCLPDGRSTPWLSPEHPQLSIFRNLTAFRYETRRDHSNEGYTRGWGPSRVNHVDVWGRKRPRHTKFISHGLPPSRRLPGVGARSRGAGLDGRLDHRHNSGGIGSGRSPQRSRISRKSGSAHRRRFHCRQICPPCPRKPRFLRQIRALRSDCKSAIVGPTPTGAS